MPLNIAQWAFKEGHMSNLVNLQQKAGGKWTKHHMVLVTDEATF